MERVKMLKGVSIMIMVLFICAIVPFGFASAETKSPISPSSNQKLGNFLQDKSNGKSPLDVEEMKNTTKTTVSGTQIIGIEFAVFFFIVGWIIMIFAAGLKHPEYKKWGRGAIFTSILGFIAIKFGPVIMYNL
ncbi:hypothetical protein ACFYU8_18450 [Brevibacillus sp. NPDC003359]|uniref:hypothetical protein n=1 Tax=unclassified Brevibacillus TaxID=2684853 RepID=UPI00369064E4